MDHRVDLEPAFVLHQRPYRETSLLLEVFGVGSGRAGLIAKGARRPKSPFRMQLEPFRPLLLSWRGRGDLGVLSGAEPDGRASLLPGAALVSGLYMNELLVRLLHRHDPHPELFGHYRRTLEALSEPGTEVEPILRIFEKHLLAAVGYGLILDHIAGAGTPIEAQERYRYITDFGPVDAAGHEGEGVKVSGATLLALAAEQSLDKDALREAKRLMRTVIDAHLGGRPLVSRKMIPRKDGPGGRRPARPGRSSSAG